MPTVLYRASEPGKDPIVQTSFAALALPSKLRQSVWLKLAACLAATGLLALSAHVQVPFWPVRLSMQNFVVLAIGLVAGSRLGVAIILAYLLEGALGLPVFQGGAGLAYMAGPTGGYLLGFVLAAGGVGLLAERGVTRSWPGLIATLLLGEVLDYLPGIAWLSMLFGPQKALAFGLLPFLPAEAVKFALLLAGGRILRRG